MSPAHLTPGHQLNRAFSACYCYLLCTLDDAWHDARVAQDPVLRNKLVRSMHPLMMDVLTPLAGVIVQQDFGAGTAGPCFEFYNEGGKPCTRARLRECIAQEPSALDAFSKPKPTEARPNPGL